MTRGVFHLDDTALLSQLRERYCYTQPRRLGKGVRPALLIVDFIEGFTSSDSPLAGQWDFEVSAAARILHGFHERRLPAVLTTVAYEPGEAEGQILAQKAPGVACLETGSRWSQLDPRLSASADDLVLAKKGASAFFGTRLASWLDDRSVDTVLIGGCVTSGCVRASVVDAAQYGFRPLVIREAVGDRARLAHETNLWDIEMRYGDVISLDEALEYLDTL